MSDKKKDLTKDEWLKGLDDLISISSGKLVSFFIQLKEIVKEYFMNIEKIKKPSSENAEQVRKYLIKMGHTHLMTQKEEHLHYLKVLEKLLGFAQPEIRRAVAFAVTVLEENKE